MNVTWTTKYRAPGVAFETSGELYGDYYWHTDGRVRSRSGALLAITKDREVASAAVAAHAAGEPPSLELVRIERLVRPTYNVMGTDLVVREDAGQVTVLRCGQTLGSYPNIAATIEALPSLA